jgi:hypothetical protein
MLDELRFIISATGFPGLFRPHPHVEQGPPVSDSVTNACFVRARRLVSPNVKVYRDIMVISENVYLFLPGRYGMPGFVEHGKEYRIKIKGT